MTTEIKLRKMKDLTIENMCDTIFTLHYLKSKGYPINSSEALNDIIDILVESYKEYGIEKFDRNNSAYLLYNKITNE